MYTGPSAVIERWPTRTTSCACAPPASMRESMSIEAAASVRPVMASSFRVESQRAERREHPLGRDRHPGHPRAEGREGVIHRVEHGAGRAADAAFAHALEAALGE